MRITALGQALIKHDLRAHPYSGYAALSNRLRTSDVVFTNLETAINGPGVGPPTRDTEFFHATEPEVLEVLRDFSADLVSTSNNHAFDLNTGGILTTIDALDRVGLAHAGTGRSLSEASRPAIFETQKGRVALVAMAAGKIREGGAATATRPGVNEIRRHPDGRFFAEDEQRNLDAISDAAKAADIVIAYHHNHYWEPDFADTPAWLRAWAKSCVDAGAHVHVGHGPPILHGIEMYRGRPLIYSLGSFIFHSRTPVGYYRPEVWDSAIADLEFRGRKLSALTITPIALEEVGIDEVRHLETRGRPLLASGDRADRILGRLATLSAAMGTRIDRAGGVGRVIL